MLYTIIPGLKVTIKEYGIQSLDNGEEGWKLELMSKREGMKEIPIRMESEGIIKIISKVTIKEYGIQSLDNGEEGWKLELMSKREGMKEIPIRMESEGIIKIISIYERDSD